MYHFYAPHACVPFCSCFFVLPFLTHQTTELTGTESDATLFKQTLGTVQEALQRAEASSFQLALSNIKTAVQRNRKRGLHTLSKNLSLEFSESLMSRSACG